MSQCGGLAAVYLQLGARVGLLGLGRPLHVQEICALDIRAF